MDSVSAGAGLAGLGGITFDGNGNVSGWETAQIGNQNLATTFTGTYSFDANGVGTLTLVHVLPAAAGEEASTATADYRFVFTSGAAGVTEIRAIRAENGKAVSTSFRSR